MTVSTGQAAAVRHVFVPRAAIGSEDYRRHSVACLARRAALLGALERVSAGCRVPDPPAHAGRACAMAWRRQGWDEGDGWTKVTRSRSRGLNLRDWAEKHQDEIECRRQRHAARGPRPHRKYEWECDICAKNNYASRQTCRLCKKPRKEVQFDEQRDDGWWDKPQASRTPDHGAAPRSPPPAQPAPRSPVQEALGPQRRSPSAGSVKAQPASPEPARSPAPDSVVAAEAALEAAQAAAFPEELLKQLEQQVCEKRRTKQAQKSRAARLQAATRKRDGLVTRLQRDEERVTEAAEILQQAQTHAEQSRGELAVVEKEVQSLVEELALSHHRPVVHPAMAGPLELHQAADALGQQGLLPESVATAAEAVGNVLRNQPVEDADLGPGEGEDEDDAEEDAEMDEDGDGGTDMPDEMREQGERIAKALAREFAETEVSDAMLTLALQLFKRRRCQDAPVLVQQASAGGTQWSCSAGSPA
ncbi:MAG: hypothetical protein GY772_12040 [bacterium]|nr:hypothetical protein [bacterium]